MAVKTGSYPPAIEFQERPIFSSREGIERGAGYIRRPGEQGRKLDSTSTGIRKQRSLDPRGLIRERSGVYTTREPPGDGGRLTGSSVMCFGPFAVPGARVAGREGHVRRT